MRVLFLLNTRCRLASCGVGVFMLLALMFAGVFYARASGEDQAIQKLNSFVQATKPDTPAARALRAGRDQIEAENWPQAAAGFQDFVREHPKDKDVDAALYWLAYALKKQGKKDEARQMLAEIYGWFTEGFDTKDLQEAKVLLQELA